jgi:hypothetical protein
METTQMSYTDKWIKKIIYNRVLLRHKEEWHPVV